MFVGTYITESAVSSQLDRSFDSFHLLFFIQFEPIESRRVKEQKTGDSLDKPAVIFKFCDTIVRLLFVVPAFDVISVDVLFNRGSSSQVEEPSGKFGLFLS